jgi:hypothetical protein
MGPKWTGTGVQVDWHWGPCGLALGSECTGTGVQVDWHWGPSGLALGSKWTGTGVQEASSSLRININLMLS